MKEIDQLTIDREYPTTDELEAFSEAAKKTARAKAFAETVKITDYATTQENLKKNIFIDDADKAFLTGYTPHLWFWHRKQIGDMYRQWLTDNGIKDCPESMVAFLQGMGWLKTKEILNDLSKED